MKRVLKRHPRVLRRSPYLAIFNMTPSGVASLKSRTIVCREVTSRLKKKNCDGYPTCSSKDDRHPMECESSSLDHLRQSGLGQGAGKKGGQRRIDPHVEFCPFELEGICNDDLCAYQHISRVKQGAGDTNSKPIPKS